MGVAVNIAHLLMKSFTAGEYKRFIRNAVNISGIQQHYLLSLLNQNANTRFGRKHYFKKIRSIEEFRDKVPVTQYEDYQPYIDDIAAGVNDVLTASRVLKLVPTSGTTGFNKFIPYTKETIAEFNKALNAWMHDLYIQHPRLKGGRSFWILSPPGEMPDIDSVVPIGFENDDSYFGKAGSWLINKTMVLPSQLKHINNTRDHLHTMCKYMLAASDLNLISVWNPSYLVSLLRYIVENREKLLYVGGRDNNFPGRLNPKRLDMLRSVLKEDIYSTEWKEVWPNLQLISCWTHGWAASQVPTIKKLFENIPVQGKGLLATEGVISIPFRDYHLPAFNSHFLEFADENGKVFLPEELEAGKTYEVIITTGSGLYRYCLNDQVRATSFHMGLPSLEFIGKSNVVSDLVGEKLSEPVVSSILETLRNESETVSRLFFLGPCSQKDSLFYTLYTDDMAIDHTIVEKLDKALMQVFYYAHARNFNQLTAPKVYYINPGEADNYIASLSSGQQAAAKQLTLNRQVNLFEKLKGQFKN
jgi:hypothetical protein